MIYLIFIATMLASVLVQYMLERRFNQYSKEGIALTGAEVAEKMLHDHGIYDVTVQSVPGKLTDHYNPTDKTLNLSEEVYGYKNVAAAAVAAHECGHAVQHATAYAPLTLRSKLVPVVQFASNTVQWVLFAGILLINVFPAVMFVGIALFALTTLFSFVTLPVEINASSRAVSWLDNAGIVNWETKPMAVSALKWAACTYVIAAISSLATLLYYIGITRRD